MSKFYQTGEKTTDVWLTPPDLVGKLGKFDLDPCSPNNLPWKLADKFYSLENGEDGLALPWVGRTWVNPPYSCWVKFLEKLSNHNNGIALIFGRTETRGFFDFVWDRADSVLFIKRRIKFIKSDFSGSGSSTAPSVLIAYGKNNTEALGKCGIEGKLVKLK
mgnify:CR=1 FL=1